MIGLASIIGSLFLSGVVVLLLFRINLLRPRLYTGLRVVFSISSVLFSTFSSGIDVLLPSWCSNKSSFSRASVSVPFRSTQVKRPPVPLGFSPLLMRESVRWVLLVYSLVFYVLNCFCPLLLYVLFRITLFVVQWFIVVYSSGFAETTYCLLGDI